MNTSHQDAKGEQYRSQQGNKHFLQHQNGDEFLREYQANYKNAAEGEDSLRHLRPGSRRLLKENVIRATKVTRMIRTHKIK